MVGFSDLGSGSAVVGQALVDLLRRSLEFGEAWVPLRGYSQPGIHHQDLVVLSSVAVVGCLLFLT